MTDKELMKRVTDGHMPDLEQVRQAIVSGAVHAPRRSIAKRLAPAIACFLILIVSVVTLSSANQTPIAPDKGDLDGSEYSHGNHAVLDSPSLEDGLGEQDQMAKVHFNILEESLSADRVYFDPETTYEKQLTLAETIEYLGRDVRPSVIPEELTAYIDQYPDAHFTIIYNNDDTVAFDQFQFTYQEEFESEAYTPLEKQLNVLVSKTGVKNDCVYVWSDDMQPSELHGQTLMIGKREIPYGPYTVVEDGPNIPAGYYDLFLAEFNYDGIYYQVIADNFTEEEFVQTLSSMLT